MTLLKPSVGKVTQIFGKDPEYYKQFGELGHNGIDIAANLGDPVVASADGTIVFEGRAYSGAEGFSSWMGDPAGICVLIDHGDFYTGYAHLSKTIVNVGQKVKRGQKIGKAGATGAANGVHVHWEVLPKPVNFGNGYAARVNPTNYGIEEQDMAEKLNLQGARVLAYLIGNKNVLTGHSALNGDLDDRLKKSWVGKELTNEYVVSLLDKATLQKTNEKMKKAFSDLDVLRHSVVDAALRKKIDAIYDKLTKDEEDEEVSSNPTKP